MKIGIAEKIEFPDVRWRDKKIKTYNTCTSI